MCIKNRLAGGANKNSIRTCFEKHRCVPKIAFAFAFLGRSWAVLGPLGAILGASWASWGPLGRLLGAFWETLSVVNLTPLRLTTEWGALGALLGRSQSRSWGLLRPLGCLLGPSLGDLGRSWALLGPSWEPLGPFGDLFGGSWEPFWRPFRSST